MDFRNWGSECGGKKKEKERQLPTLGKGRAFESMKLSARNLRERGKPNMEKKKENSDQRVGGERNNF